LNFQNTLDLEFPGTDAVGIVPMHLSMTYRTIRKLDRRDSFKLSPALTAIQFSQSAKLADAFSRNNYLNMRNASNDLEELELIVSSTRAATFLNRDSRLGKMQQANGPLPNVPLTLSSGLTLVLYDRTNFGFLRLAVSKT
jgi:hypothetical protein